MGQERISPISSLISHIFVCVCCMRHLFIINPAAGKRETTAKLEQQLKTLSFPHEVVYTEGAGDAKRIAAEAAALGEPVRIYACGGDGTLNEVVNGAAGHDHVAVTCVPKGTGNDFLKVFGGIRNKCVFSAHNVFDCGKKVFIFSENYESIKSVFFCGGNRFIEANCIYLLFCKIIGRKSHNVNKFSI